MGGVPTKEIKQKPSSKPSRTAEAVRIPKAAMKQVWLQGNDKNGESLFENLKVRLIFPVENRAALCNSQTETLRQSLFRKPMGRSAPRSFLRGLASAQLAKKIRNVTRSHYF